MKTKLLVLACALAMGACSGVTCATEQGPVTVARGGAVVVPVVIDVDATPATRDTAGTLAAMLANITGAPFAVTESASPTTGITVGLAGDFTSAATYAPAFWISGPGAAPGHMVVWSHGSTVTLAAADDQSLRNAIWELLHSIGYRQYAPGPTWEVVPSIPSLTVDVALDQHPRYASRRIFFGWGQWPENQPAYQDWQQKNQMLGGVGMSVGHAWQAIVSDPANHFADHSDWIATGSVPGLEKLCVMAPGLQEVVIEWALRQLRAHPASYLSLEPSDGGGWEGCASDVGLTPSDRVVILANAVSEAIQAEFPGVVVTFYAYNQHSAAPTHVQVGPHVVIYPATSYAVASAAELMADWSRCDPGPCATRFGLRDYLGIYIGHRDLPGAAPETRPDEVAPALDQYASLGAEAYLAEATDAWGPTGPGFWIAARSLSAPAGSTTDVAGLVEDFIQRAFNGIPAMREFYALMLGPEAQLLSRHTVGTLYRHLDEANGSPLATPAVLRRIQDLVLYLHYVELWQDTQYSTGGAHQAAFEALVRFAYRSRQHMIMHSYALYRDPRVSGATIPPGAEWNVPEPTNPWKDSTPFTDVELAAILASGIASNPVLPVVRRTFEGPLVPAAVPDVAAAYANLGHASSIYMRDRQQWWTWVEPASTAVDFQVVPGFVYHGGALDARLVSVGSPGDTVQSSATIPGTYAREPAPYPWAPVSLTTTTSGLHRLEFVDNHTAFLFDSPAGRRLVADAGLPIRGLAFPLVHRHTMYFYVPSDTTEIAGWTSNFGTLRDSAGFAHRTFEGTPRPEHFVVAVPEEQRGRVWFCMSCVGRVALLNVPPQMAMHSHEFLLPQSVVTSDMRARWR